MKQYSMKHPFFSSLIKIFLFLSPVHGFAQIETRPVEKVEALFYFLENFYVEDVNLQDAAENALKAVLKELDPHSYYMSPKEVKESEEQLGGNFEGIGIQFNIHHDTILVVSPISGGPSEKAGIRSGDKIITINDTLVAGTQITNSDVFRWLRGPKGTRVILGIQRIGEKKLLPFTIIRDKIPVYSVDAVYMAAPSIGYIKINRFSGTTVSEFKAGIDKLKLQGCKDLILDLSDNSGGYLHAAVELADEFFPAGELVVYTEGRKSPRKDYKTSSRGGFLSGKLVILINEGSASAAEIVAGAVQDLDRGLLIGRRSFGKGLVQNGFPMPDGSAIRLTIARYFTPSGRFIQAPYESGTEKYFEDLYSRFKNGELTNPELIKFPDSLKFQTRNKRIVYGGGGIMPDYFIPIDTSFFSSYLNEVSRKNLLYETMLDFIETARDSLKNLYSTEDAFIEGFNPKDALWPKFISTVEKAEIVVSEEDASKSNEWILIRLKALTAQNLYTRDAFFKVVNKAEESYLKAIEILQKR
jgi:carboxyl-terminal processing protease